MSRISLPKTNTPPRLSLLAQEPNAAPSGADLWSLYTARRHTDIIKAVDSRLPYMGDDLHISGLSLVSLGHVEAGINRLKAAMMLHPEVMHAYTNAAVVLAEVEQHETAEWFMREALPRFATNANVHFLLGNALLQQDRPEEAASHFRQAISIEPDHHDARMNLANSLRRLGQEDEAISLYEEILSKVTRQDALHNLIVALNETHRQARARELAEHNLTLGRYPQTEFTLATMLLAEGDYARGWDLFRSRWQCAMARAEVSQFTKPIPETLDQIRGKFVLLTHEQGLGDSLQFCRYASLMVPHAERVALLVPPHLRRLMIASLPASVQVISSRAEIANAHNYEVPLLNCPHLLGTVVSTIPNTIPYLRVPEETRRGAMLPKATEALRVGLVWAGQSRPNYALRETDKRRSMHLSRLVSLSEVPGIQWHSLQLGEPSGQLAEISRQWPLNPCLDTVTDYLDTAAIIEQLDLVITVDTSVAHCAAGLGVPTWIMSRYDGCWRWLERGRSDSPWYPGVVRLFWQQTPGDWDSVVQEVRDALSGFARQPRKA